MKFKISIMGILGMISMLSVLIYVIGKSINNRILQTIGLIGILVIGLFPIAIILEQRHQ